MKDTYGDTATVSDNGLEVLLEAAVRTNGSGHIEYDGTTSVSLSFDPATARKLARKLKKAADKAEDHL